MWKYNHTDELYHYGIPGMKWGHRKSIYQTVTGNIRKKQRSKIVKEQKELNGALKELKGISKNPSGFAKTKLSTGIRNKQIKKYTALKKENKKALKELDSIDKYQAKKAADKANKKAYIEKRSKQILKGENAFWKAYDKITGAHKIAAEMEWNAGAKPNGKGGYVRRKNR